MAFFKLKEDITPILWVCFESTVAIATINKIIPSKHKVK